jgi:hypothetical protein
MHISVFLACARLRQGTNNATRRAADGSDETNALFHRLLAYKGVRSAIRTVFEQVDGTVLAMHFSKNGTTLALFTTIATLGTPRDVTAQELRIESFFPMNEETAGILRSWASKQNEAKPSNQH